MPQSFQLMKLDSMYLINTSSIVVTGLSGTFIHVD